MTPRAQLASSLSRFDRPVASLARAIVSRLRTRMPSANQLVYDNYNALAIGFGPSPRTSEAIVSLAIYARGVNLYFLYGAYLTDPDRLLEGNGTRGRFVRLPTAERLADPGVQALLAAAIADCDPPLPATGRIRTIVKSVAAKQRPRRPPAGRTARRG